MRIGGHAHRFLARGGHAGRVASLFRHGVNVRFERVSVPIFITLQNARVPLQPWAIGVQTVPTLRVGDVVVGRALRLHLTHAAVFDLRAIQVDPLTIEPLPPSTWIRVVETVGALRRLLQAARDRFPPDPFQGEIDARVADWSATGDPDALAGILGLGAGLTPAGDDRLVGLLAGLLALSRTSFSAVGELGALRSRLRSARLLARTTPPAAQMVVAAVDGAFPEPVCDLVKALADPHGTPARAAKRLVALGASSGASMLQGMLDGLMQGADARRTPGGAAGGPTGSRQARFGRP